MKKTLSRLLFLLLLFLSITTATAEVEVTKVVPISGCGASDGSITIHAEGTAGPFFITITGPNGYIYYRSDHQGELKIFNLSSPGTYHFDIQLYNSECSLTLTANLPCLLPAGTISTFGIKTTCSGASEGAILISDGSFSDQATFEWTGPDGFMANTKNINGLAAGEYHLLLKDWCSSGYWCQRVETFVVKEIGLVATNICGQGGSAIDLELVDFTNWNVNPTYEWSNGGTTQDISGLGSGKYCVTVSLPSCSMNLCQTVNGNMFDIDEPEVITKACGGASDGKIRFKIKTNVTISNPGGCSVYYDVDWNNQTQTVLENENVYLDGFASGANCFTVTGPFTDCVVRIPPPCQSTRCFEMEGFSLDIVDVQNIDICDGNKPPCNAEIEVASNFSNLEWQGPNQYSNVTKVVGGLVKSTKLCLGGYKITGQEEGCTLSRYVDVCCCDVVNDPNPNPLPSYQCYRAPAIVITGLINHDWESVGQGAISIQNVLSTTYTYKWSGPDGYQNNIKDIKNLSKGEYCVTISDGCGHEWTKCFWVNDGCNILALKSLFTVEQEPCSRLTDGIVKVSIPNPNKVSIDIYFDDLSVTSLVGNPASYTFSNVSSGSHAIKLIYEDCILTGTIEVDSKRETYELVGYDEDKQECYYDIMCNDLKLSHQAEAPKVLNKWIAPDPSLKTGCKIDYSCRGQYSWTVKEKLEVSRAWIYNLKVLEFKANGLIPDGAPFPRELKGMKLCRKLLYCPLNLDIFMFYSGPFVGDGKSLSSSNKNCLRRRCGLSIDEYCAGSAVSFLPEPPKNPSACSVFDLRSAKLIELQYAYFHGYFAAYSNFGSTQLFSLIVDNFGDERAYCTDVYFCKKDFSVVNSSLSTVNCDPIVPLDGSGYSPACQDLSQVVSGENQRVVYCNSNSLIDPYYVVVVNLDDWSMLNANQISNTLLVSGSGDEQFIGFSNYYIDGFQGVKGTVKSEKKNELYDFMPGEDVLRTLRENDGLVFFSNDVDNSITYRLYETSEENQYGVFFQGDSNGWLKTLEVDTIESDLEISYYQRDMKEFVLGGVYKGVLVFDGKLVDKSDEETAFVLRMNEEGQLISFNSILGIDDKIDVVFSENDTESLLVAGKSKLNHLSYDDNNFSSAAPFYFVALLEKNKPFEIVNSLYLNNETSIVDVAMEESISTYSLAFSDVSFVKSESDTLFQDILNSFVVMNFESFGDMNWLKAYPQNNIDENNFDMTYVGDTLYVGMTLLGDIDLDGQKIINLGESDILTFKLVDDSYVDIKSFGTVDDETVSDITVLEGVFYFAGTFSGETKERDLGAIKVIDILPQISSASKVYMSYIDEISPKSNYRVQSTDSNTITDLTISPNPFFDGFVVYLTSSAGIFSLDVYDVLGEKVLNRFINTQGGESSIFVGFPFPPGIYMVKIQDDNGNTFVKKIVKQ